MNLSLDLIQLQLPIFFTKYPEMTIMKADKSSIRLHGKILVHRSVKNFVICNTYTLDIVIPLESTQLPYIIDSGKHISTKYPHCYQDGSLCLATNTDIRIRFLDHFSLLEWMDEYVEPYYVTYEYYQRFNRFPFGDREHGATGIAQSYKDIFQTKSVRDAFNILLYIRNNAYRGHAACPCGSNLHLRSCHGSKILPFYQDKRLNKILLDDLKLIEEEIKSK